MTALAAQRYMSRYGMTEEQFARVVVRRARTLWAIPMAISAATSPSTMCLNSPRVAYPYKRFDICPRSSGAAAVVLSNLDVAKAKMQPAGFRERRQRHHAFGLHGDRMGSLFETEFSDHDGEHIAAHEAYRQAGIYRPVEPDSGCRAYDPFSTFQFPMLESLGFCGRGRAAAISDAGGWDLHSGHVAVGPSGGTLCTNPIGVTGLVRVVDAANQILGKSGAKPGEGGEEHRRHRGRRIDPVFHRHGVGRRSYRQGSTANEHGNRRQRDPRRVARRYNYSVGKVAGHFFDGLKQRKILASLCSTSGIAYLPPRAYCERSFEPCDGWVEVGHEGTIEAATLVTAQFENLPPPPYAIAYARLDGASTALVNFRAGHGPVRRPGRHGEAEARHADQGGLQGRTGRPHHGFSL